MEGSAGRETPHEMDGAAALAELALDVRWSWNHATDELWRRLEPEVWEMTHNPWVVLRTASRDKIKTLLADSGFRHQIDTLLDMRRRALLAPAWFQRSQKEHTLRCIAYFSMEFMLSEALPIYSGGLGNVAGDQLKACSDMGIPVVGVGLLYQQGYFRQVIDKEGVQHALYPYNDPGQLPLTPIHQHNGEWLRLQLELPGCSVWLRAWEVQVGRVKLYLLDSNDGANLPAHRGITSQLYGGGPEHRLQQELVLGIGGWRLLNELGIQPDVCHLNEGHAAFAVLERARSFMVQSGQPFDVALSVTRAGNLFTTHTAVGAGFDRFSPALIEQYLGGYAEEKLRISCNDLLALGRMDSGDASEGFNMAHLAIRGSGAVNAVSRLHGQVSRRLFQPLFPRRPVEEVPVGHVTNGVHMPTWDSAPADELWTAACGKDRWLSSSTDLGAGIRRVSTRRLWEFRAAAKTAFVAYVRQRYEQQLAAAGASASLIAAAKHVFDPAVLTLGFARRFTPYKRPNLLLTDPERLLSILTHSDRPVQLVLAGKAHPADLEGQALIRKWFEFIERPAARARVVFLNDYDMQLAEHLVQGIDVWVNTPLRPWEASGTSGMKVLVNGGVNLTELDGWWAEAFAPHLGWAWGDGREHDGDTLLDSAEANELYGLLEREVVPEFYARDVDGIPSAWVNRIRESMATLTPQFSAHRTVMEYTQRHYVEASDAYHSRAQDSAASGRKIAAWQRELDKVWSTLRFGEVKVTTIRGQHLFDVEVYLNALDPATLRVELYSAGSASSEPHTQPMELRAVKRSETGCHCYHAAVEASRSAVDYTARLVPHHVGVSVPLENARILWQR